MLTNTERQQIVEEVNAGTYGIDEALDDIAAAQKGEEVRKALYAEALVLNREGHAGSTDMIARQQIANLQTSVNGQISTLRTEVGEDIDDLETALNSGLATQNGRIAAQDATIANVVANYNVEYGSTELWASTGETGALAAGTTVTLSEDVSHFDYIDIYSFCGNSNVLDTVPVDAKLQSSQGYALRWVNLSDPGSGTYEAYVRIVETKIKIIGTTLTIVHQVTYRNGSAVSVSGAEITQSNRSTYVGEFGIMKVVGRKITANTEVTDIRTGADGTTYNSAGAAVRAQVQNLDSRIPAVDDTLSVQGAAADAAAVGAAVAAASQTGGGSGLTTEIKTALMNCFEHVAWIDEDGQALLDLLEEALYPPVNLVSISATYSQSGTVYDSDTLNSLKEDLTVIATMDDGSTEPVDSSRYTLSGTLTVGTSTITVTYTGKTATFSVTVSAEGWTITKEIGDNYSAGCLTLSSGEVDTGDTGWYTSDFIDVPDGATSFYRTTSRESDWYMSWYDESKAFLGNALSGTYSRNGQYGGGFTDSDGNVWNVVPKGAKYFRCSWRTNATWTSVTFEQNKKLTQDVAPQYDKLYVYDYDETATDNVLNTDYIKCDGLAYAQIRPVIRRYINWYDADFVQVSQEAIANNVGNNLEIPSDAVYMKFTNTNGIGRGGGSVTRIGQGLIKFTEETVSAW